MSKDKNLVPELRFPEFIEKAHWEEKTLADLADRITNKVGEKKLTTVSISAGIGFVSQVEKFSRDISGDQYKNYIHLKEGEFSYNKGNSKKFPQGCIYKLKEFKEVAVPNAFISFRFKSKVVPDFFQGYFDNNYHGAQLLKFITSGARMDGLLNISPDDFFGIILPTPKDREEQEKIASCLSSLDELIAAYSEKLDALKDHKKGLMQNLFPQEGQKVPKYRFPEYEKEGEWEERPLIRLADRIIEKNNDCKIERVFTNSAVNGIVDQLDYFDKNIANKSNLENYYLIEDGDYVYNPRVSNEAPVGPISKNRTGQTGAMSPLYTVFRFKDRDNDFYEHYFKSSHWLNSIRKAANTGARFDRMSITDSVFMDIPVLYPRPEEQQKIASCLSPVDELIKAQIEKIEQLQRHKKGLMQGLFPKIDN